VISTYAYTGTPDAILPVERVIPPKASIVAARGLPRLDNMRTVMAAGTPLPPIWVYQHEGYTYLIAGLHRYRVTREMGYTHIPVVFCSDADFPIRPFTLSDYAEVSAQG
jgi:hypothetical protein